MLSYMGLSGGDGGGIEPPAVALVVVSVEYIVH